MSTYWGYRCVDCNENSPAWFNHGESILREIAEFWDHIREIRRSRSLYVSTQDPAHDTEPIEFFDAHSGHRVVLRNEYGDTVPLITPEREAELRYYAEREKISNINEDL